MKRPPLASVLLLASVLPADAASVVTPQPRPRLSPEIIVTLTASKTSPVETEPEAAPAVLSADPATLERARSEVVRMAPYIVSEPRSNMPSSTQVLTPKGKLDLAMKRNPGLTFLSFWGLNNKVGLALLEDDLRRERMREAADLWSLYLIK